MTEYISLSYNVAKEGKATYTKKNIVFTNLFEDKEKIADYAKESVAALYDMGIINGVSATEFDPLSQATRAQAAKIIYGVLKALD